MPVSYTHLAYVELAWTEGGESVASLVPEDELGLTLRLDGSGAPVSAEFTSRELSLIHI